MPGAPGAAAALSSPRAAAPVAAEPPPVADRPDHRARGPCVPPRGARLPAGWGSRGAHRPRLRDAARPHPPAVGDARLPAVRRRPGRRDHQDAPRAGRRGGGQRAARQHRRRAGRRSAAGEGSAPDQTQAGADARPGSSRSGWRWSTPCSRSAAARPAHPHGPGGRRAAPARKGLGGDRAAAAARRTQDPVQRRAHRTPQLRDRRSRSPDQGGPARPRRHDERRRARGGRRCVAPLPARPGTSCPPARSWPAYPWPRTWPAPRPRLGGNRVSNIFTTLATDIDDPHERLREISRTTGESKLVHQTLGANMLVDWVQFAPPAPLSAAMRLYSRSRAASKHPSPFNVVVSNVRGPGVTSLDLGRRSCADLLQRRPDP